MGGEVYLAEYGRAKTIHFDLVEVDGVDLRVDAVDGGSDCIVMTDEAAEGTATNDFVDEGTGYSLLLDAGEMTGARITVYVIDSATKVWLDKTIQIETFGHLSSAHPFLSPYWTNGAVNDGSASSTVWTFDGFTEATANHVIGSELTFTSGANAGQCRTVTDYTSTVITVSPAFLAAPADNDEFVLDARPTTSAGNVPAIDISLGATTADLLDKLGAVDEAAATGDPSSTESAMQYIKQLVNLLAGSDGIASLPNAQAPANNVNVFEIIRAIYDDTNAINAKMPNTDLLGVVASGVVETSGSNSSTQVQTDLGEATDNHYNNMGILFINSGAERGQARLIDDYVGASGVVSWLDPLTGTPADSSPFVIIPAWQVPLVAGAVDDIWDELLTGALHNVPTSSGRRLRQLEEAFVLAEGVIDTVTNGHTITLDTGAVATAEFYEHARLQIEEGTGAGQSRIIVGYTSGRVVTLDSDFITNPDTASRYSIVAADVHVAVSDADLAQGFVATATSTTQITLDAGAEANADFYNEELIIFTHGTGAGQATHITGYTAGRVVTMSPALDTAVGTDTVYHIQAAVPISQMVKEIWDEAMVASTGAPAITGSMRAFMEWWATLSRNVVNQTATTTTVRNDADDGDISTSTVSDDGTTFVRGEFST